MNEGRKEGKEVGVNPASGWVGLVGFGKRSLQVSLNGGEPDVDLRDRMHAGSQSALAHLPTYLLRRRGQEQVRGGLRRKRVEHNCSLLPIVQYTEKNSKASTTPLPLPSLLRI